MAYSYVKEFGMDENTTLISQQGQIKASDKYNYILDKEVQRLLKVRMHTTPPISVHLA